MKFSQEDNIVANFVEIITAFIDHTHVSTILENV